MIGQEKRFCCLCEDMLVGMGHNPAPLADHPERCCDYCNTHRVIPERINRMMQGGAW